MNLRHTFVYIPFYSSCFGMGKKNIFIKENYWKKVKKIVGENAGSPGEWQVHALLVTVWGNGNLMEKEKVVRKMMGSWKQGLGCGKEYSLSTP